ncbi:MAG: peptidase C39 family protein [Aquabacterium sp.]|uniref:C39 family peptidase n=1 Tax=Aquabacterium sp. TaxID=1872578 RepID=UPI00121E734D|nr:C39 family peptidase [Aquabacterium sp.]TAK94124.1 MAG: peptidase C39 family protein [Aquabacterium sp.]
MLGMLLGIIASAIGESAGTAIHPPVDKPQGEFQLPMVVVGGGISPMPVTIKPYSEFKFENIIHQAYDYSCGSAALVTVINNYLGIKVTEQQAMEGMLSHGERDKIIERRGFSLLDMKRYVASLGAIGAGFRGEMSDLEKLTQPAIVPIDYAGFKHFVVFRGIRDGRVFIADPSAGHIVFSVEQFAKLWDRGTLFLLSLPADTGKPLTNLALTDRELGVIDSDSVRKQAVLTSPDRTEALRNAVQAGIGVFNLRKQ